MNSGKKWVLGLLAFGACGGLIAVTHWQRPENSVRWSFTQIHTSLVRPSHVRNQNEKVIRFLTPRVTVYGREMSPEEFLVAYIPPSTADVITTELCSAVPEHQLVRMKDLVYCFVGGEGTLWRLHWVGKEKCGCKP
jgi:hypothetical protein